MLRTISSPSRSDHVWATSNSTTRPAGQSECLLAFLSVHIAIFDGEVIRIIEDQLRRFETHAVLYEIRTTLGVNPTRRA